MTAQRPDVKPPQEGASQDGASQDGPPSKTSSDEGAAPRPAWLRWLPLGVILLALVLALALGLHRFLSFEMLAAQREDLQAFVVERGAWAALGFIALYALVVAVSLPAATPLTFFGGFLFGTLPAAAYVVLGATLGASVLFWAARSALGEVLRRRVGGRAERMREGFRKDAFSYLLVLRLLPIFPFWLVNLVPAVLGVPFRTYILATAIGMTPGTIIYASLGSGLGAVLEAGERPNLGVIFRPEILLPLVGLAILALLPVIYRRWRARRQPL